VRVIGIDPGTVSVDLCGLADGRVFLDQSIPTADALGEPSRIVELLEAASPIDLVAGPSGYGLPVALASDLTESDIRLACLAPRGEAGGIGGLAALLRALARASMPVVVTPGVVHLATVPAHRKINRVDMGTADKVCAVALAIHEQARNRGSSERDVSFILLELGGAFTAAIAVEGGRIVDGLGGSSGPIGPAASGALDAEVAYLAERIAKRDVFSGGALSVAGTPDAPADALADATTPAGQIAREAYVEDAVKAVARLKVSAPGARTVVLSGRLGRAAGIRDALSKRLATAIADISVEVLKGFAAVSKHAAQGAAIVADGLAGGASAAIVDRLGIREARGTVLDHLYVISPEAARARLGITG
jgi:predicted butyrate kinase (DUF1464 family)